jgi:hypothetical protein
MLRAGDEVLHRPSGEKWLLACDEVRGEIICCGWPETFARASDCELLEAATDEQRLSILQQVSRGAGSDTRGSRAQRQLEGLADGKRRVYVASSWRNKYQPDVVSDLRAAGHLVYDFRQPAPGLSGFAWSDIDQAWQGWTTAEYIDALKHPVAQRGFALDKEALDRCDACVLVLPCGRSAHLEAGYMIGQGKRTVIYLPERGEPELMNLLAEGVAASMDDVLRMLEPVAWAPRA